MRDVPELELWTNMPAVWDETRVLHDRIGEVATLARRRGAQWYVGTLNAGERRTVAIPLNFLEVGRSYQAFICADGSPAGSERRKVDVTRRTVTRDDVLKADMAASGGHAIRLVPVK